MRYVGLIACPDCQSPLDSEALVCPYCHSTAAASSPWKCRLTAGWMAAICGLLVALLCCDRFLGTNLMRQLWELLRAE